MNILENIPYNDDKMGSRKVADTKPMLIMQIALKAGQSVPQHNANANVHLLVIKGELEVDLDGKCNYLKEGDLLAVDYQTRMTIRNSGAGDAMFLVLKTPNPSEIPKETNE